MVYLKTYPLVKDKAGKIEPFIGKPNGWQLFLAYIFRYSYLLTLLAMFILGFSQPTFINLILVALFLIFFSRGDNLIVVKREKDGVEKTTLTTFCKHYWLVIVYYTLACILAKYIYFLFFPGSSEEYLRPSGISETYNWVVNFSLTNYCPSNTTPWFIVFVLAELQIIIYRSTIYNHLSFSIMNYLT